MSRRPMQADDLLRFKLVSDPQVHPGGSRILFTEKHVGEKNKSVTNLFTVDLDGAVMQWTQGDGGNGGGRWSPDGTQIAFVSGRDKPASQIFMLSATGGEARQLTKFPEGSLGEIKWSPDGKWIAVAFRPTHETWTDAAKKDREAKGLSTPPREIDDIWYRLDGDGYFLGQRYAIYLVDAATGELRELYAKAPDGNYGFDWSPRSDELVVIHTANARPSVEKPNDQIYRLKLDGTARQLPGLSLGEKSTPRWSPDGMSIAYVGDEHPDDPWGAYNRHLFVVSAEGGTARCLTSGSDYCLTTGTLSDSKDAGYEATVLWSPDSKAIYLGIGWHGEAQLGYADAENGGVTLLTHGNHLVTVGSLSRDGEQFGCVFGNATRLGEIAIYDLSVHPDEPVVLTHFNDELLAEREVKQPEEIWVEAEDGWKVQAWVIRSATSDSPGPAVLEVHGGPHAQYGWAFFHEFQVLAAAGYTIVYSNPRGSKGYGEAHCMAIQGAWGDRDWVDVQAVTAWMKTQSDIDAARIGIMGGSYGGYMTNWAVGHSKDYKAAITDRCVSSLVSLSMNSDFVGLPDAYWPGCAWGSIDRISELWRQSPISYFETVTTPMLIIHSEGDLRCNVEQSEQVFTALQYNGVPSRFVRYPSETSHGMSRSGPPDLRLHRLGEIVAWWQKYL